MELPGFIPGHGADWERRRRRHHREAASVASATASCPLAMTGLAGLTSGDPSREEAHEASKTGFHGIEAGAELAGQHFHVRLHGERDMVAGNFVNLDSPKSEASPLRPEELVLRSRPLAGDKKSDFARIRLGKVRL